MAIPGTDKKAPSPTNPKTVEGSPLPKSKSFPRK